MPAGQRRLIFTGNVNTNLFNKYTAGANVGGLNASVRRALKRRAVSAAGTMNAQGQFFPGKACCSAEIENVPIDTVPIDNDSTRQVEPEPLTVTFNLSVTQAGQTANSGGPIFLELYENDKTTPIYVFGNDSIIDNKLKLNNGLPFEQDSNYSDTFSIQDNLSEFYVKLSSGTTDGLNFDNVTINYNDNTYSFTTEDDVNKGTEANNYTGTDNTVGWLDSPPGAAGPKIRWYIVTDYSGGLGATVGGDYHWGLRATDDATATTTTTSSPIINIYSNDFYDYYYCLANYVAGSTETPTYNYEGKGSTVSNISMTSGIMNFRESGTYNITISNPNGYDVTIVCTGAGGGGGGSDDDHNVGGGGGGSGGTSMMTFPQMTSGTYYIKVGKGGPKGSYDDSHSDGVYYKNGTSGTSTQFLDTDSTTALVSAGGGGGGYHWDTDGNQYGGTGGTAGSGSSQNGSTGGQGAWSGTTTGHNGTTALLDPLTYNIAHIGQMTTFLGGSGGGGGYGASSPAGKKGYGGRYDYVNTSNSDMNGNYYCGGDGGGTNGNYYGSNGAYSSNSNNISESTSSNYFMMTTCVAASTQTLSDGSIGWENTCPILGTNMGYGYLAGAGGGGGMFVSGWNNVYDGGDGADGMCSIIFNPPGYNANYYPHNWSITIFW